MKTPVRSPYCWQKERFRNPAYANSGESGIDGSDKDHAFAICSPQQFNLLGATSSDWGKSFKLADNIGLGLFSGTTYNIIGNAGTPFTGSLNGQDYSISFLTYTGSATDDDLGLIGRATGAELSRLHLVQPEVRGDQNIGSLIGYSSGGSFSQVSIVGGLVQGNQSVGGLVGNTSASIQNSFVNGTQILDRGTPGSWFGGVVGLLDGNSTRIKICYARAEVKASSSLYVGGFIGGELMPTTPTVEDSFAISNVQGDDSGGSRVGWFSGQYAFNGSYINNFFDSSGGSCSNASGSCNTLAAMGVVTSGANSEYFYLPTSTPLSNWDFLTVWKSKPGSLPLLIKKEGQ